MRKDIFEEVERLVLWTKAAKHAGAGMSRGSRTRVRSSQQGLWRYAEGVERDLVLR